MTTKNNKVNVQVDFQESLQAAQRHLARRDPVMRDLIRKYGDCRLKPHTRYFITLVGSIISQQLSTKAADTIQGRFFALYAPARYPTARRILETPDEQIRATGISGQKMRYIRDLAARTEDGSVRLRTLARMPDEEIIEMLTQIKGIGVWTVQMFLIFSLGRLDVLPVGDLGVRKAIERSYRLESIPDAPVIEEIATKWQWRPYTSVASWYLWRSLENKP
ncbi:MAG: DNA-3-methyladenine glycosylase family protein [Blastocatellia bacterium]